MADKLTYYWFDEEATGGLKFDSNKAYTLSEIDKILKQNGTRKINGFFVNYGTKGQAFFSRRVIVSTENDDFLQIRKIFDTINYDLDCTREKRVNSLLDLEIEAEKDDIFNRNLKVSKDMGLG